MTDPENLSQPVRDDDARSADRPWAVRVVDRTRRLLISRQREWLRGLYQGGRGNSTAKRYARFWAFVFRLKLQSRRWVTLEVVGRHSGKPRQFPLGMADWEGHWYLVSMLGECNWVRNVRAANGRAALHGRFSSRVTLREVPVEQRAPILKRYLDKVPGGRPHIPVDRHAPRQELAAVAAQTPIFLVAPGWRENCFAD